MRKLTVLGAAFVFCAASASMASADTNGRWLVMGNAKGCAMASVGANEARITLVKPREEGAEMLTWLSASGWTSGTPISWRYEDGARSADLRVRHLGGWTSIKGVRMGPTSISLIGKPGEPSLFAIMSEIIAKDLAAPRLELSDETGATIASFTLRGFDGALEELEGCMAGPTAPGP